ncbi:Cullin repeat-like-containing domain protein [Gautieria morchelliformis]|nr:Cullin repeat-like-containing domain protein [Gautieria morchelliformis]
MSLRKRADGSKTAKEAPRIQQRLQKGGKDAPKSRVDDRIKKRMTMRYADISGPTSLSIPNIPSLPTISRSGSKDEGGQPLLVESPGAEDPKRADVKAMEQDHFDPEAYLKVKLANSTEAELRALQSSLEASKAATAIDLQKNVYKNYEQFVSISKEISTLENDMMELKESLSEWKSMPSLLQVDDSAASDRRRVTRSSVADLRTLYATQLQSLHSSIEGSAKFVPATPGRHVVAEMGEVSALNPATYKAEHAVHFVLLDDALLVAKRRRKRTGGSGRLVAERCWMLNDITMQDVKDANEVTNVIKLRHGKETHVYRIGRVKEKKTLLNAFRQASEELAARKRKQREGEHERRRSVWADGNRSSLAVPDSELMPSLPDWLGEIGAREGLDGAKVKAEQDSRWVGDFSDDLTVAIALRQWDEAVALVESGEKRLSKTPLLKPKLTPLTASLTSALLQSLSDPMQRKSSVVHLTALLERLHAGAAARSAFLDMRGELMRKRVRALRFEGSVELYISDLAVVVFTGIKHTADWFLASFKENDTASSLVQWAKEQIESYTEMFKKQVHGSDVAPQTVQDCLDITRLQSRKLLKDNSLDFSHLLDKLLAPPTAPVSPPSFSRRDPVSSPRVVLEAPPSPISDVLQTPRPPRILPPRSLDRPSSSAGRARPTVASQRRGGMI